MDATRSGHHFHGALRIESCLAMEKCTRVEPSFLDPPHGDSISARNSDCIGNQARAQRASDRDRFSVVLPTHTSFASSEISAAASTFDTGQFFFAVSAISWNFAASRPGTLAVVVR